MAVIEEVPEDRVEIITVNHPSGKSSFSVSLFGATVTSWKIFNTEMLFLSDKAVLDGTTPIRGGIPLVFPQFGNGSLAKHGFARTSIWEHLKTEEDKETYEIYSRFRLLPTNDIRAVWDYKFELLYEVRLGLTTLTCSMSLINHDTKEIPFDILFHNYFIVGDYEKANVNGLENCQYIDQVKGGAGIDRNKTILFSKEGEVDRIYTRSSQFVADKYRPSSILSVGDGGNADVVVNVVNLDNIVVWNPGKDKSQALSDLADDGYTKFVCLEAGEVGNKLVLPPSKTWNGGQKLTLRIVSSVANKVRAETAENAYPKMDRIQGL